MSGPGWRHGEDQESGLAPSDTSHGLVFPTVADESRGCEYVDLRSLAVGGMPLVDPHQARGSDEVAMGAQLRDLTPYASALHFFGAELRHHRQLAGLSLRRLGPQVFVSPSQLGLVEAARRFPSMDLAGRCDSVLDTGGVLARLHPLVTAERAVRQGEPDLPAFATQQLKALLRLLVTAGDPTLPAGS